jgi:glyoxylase-like metal-dependent hydrolase (beta-lactamase superfamily II)
MAWRKAWRQRRKAVRKPAWLIPGHDDPGKMQTQTVLGAVDDAEEPCRRMEPEL